MTLYVVRHGESVGNDHQIVQGRDFDPGLTETGRKQAAQVAADLDTRIADRVTVYTSPARRSRETAAVLGDVLGEDPVVDDALVEIDPGVLAGVAKPILSERHPEHLAVWEARGDLDAIPRAETGDEAQARALLVLDRLAEASGDQVVVAHAAFNRYLLNTARGDERTSSVGYEPTDWSTATELLGGVTQEELPNGKRGDVRCVRTREAAYVLKRETGVDASTLAFREWLTDYVNSKVPLLPNVLAWNVRNGVARTVLAYESGSHEYGPLSTERTRLLCDRVTQLSTLLRQTDRSFPISTLAGRIEQTSASVPDPAVAALGRQLLDAECVSSPAQSAYIHYDLHRDNVLFDDDSVTLLDLDGFCRASPMYQPASLFTAGFLLEDVSGFDLDAFVDYWPAPLDRERLAVLMLARAYVGVAFFVRRHAERGLSAAEADILDRYVQAAQHIAREHLDWSLPDGLSAVCHIDVV